MATHSSILAWRIPWREEPGGLQSMGRKESEMTEQLNFHFHFPMCNTAGPYWLSIISVVVCTC